MAITSSKGLVELVPYNSENEPISSNRFVSKEEAMNALFSAPNFLTQVLIPLSTEHGKILPRQEILNMSVKPTIMSFYKNDPNADQPVDHWYEFS